MVEAGGRTSGAVGRAQLLHRKNGYLQSDAERISCTPTGRISSGSHPCGRGLCVGAQPSMRGPQPSPADIELTKWIVEGARILALTFLDHVIVVAELGGGLGISASTSQHSCDARRRKNKTPDFAYDRSTYSVM